MGLKDKLRAWLISLVREAMRAEGIAGMPQSHNEPYLPTATVWSPTKRAPLADMQPWPGLGSPFTRNTVQLATTNSEPSFEQMQAEAIKEQEKYYEPRS